MSDLYLNFNSLPNYCFSNWKMFKPNEYHTVRNFQQTVLILMWDGTLHFTENGVPVEVRKHEFYLQHPGTAQAGHRPSGGAVYYYVHFYSAFSEEKPGLQKRGSFAPETILPYIEELDFLQKSPDSSALEKSIPLFSLLKALLSQTSTVTAQDILAEKIMNQLVASYNQRFSLTSIAEEFFFSKNYIIRVFKDKYGTTPGQYVSKIRLNQAIRLLLHTEMPVSEIALSCGYEDVSVFHKAFLKQFGKPPAKWKKENKPHP